MNEITYADIGKVIAIKQAQQKHDTAADKALQYLRTGKRPPLWKRKVTGSDANVI